LSRIEISDALAPLDLDAHALDAALRNAFGLSERWLAAPPVEMKSLVRDIVEQITVAAEIPAIAKTKNMRRYRKSESLLRLWFRSLILQTGSKIAL
jgi:hypothetical protein